MSTMDFAAWLRKRLQEREWNGTQFAARLGKRPSVVSRWLRGERLPDPQSSDLVADILGVDRDVVLALAGHRPEPEPIPDDDPRRHIHALVDRIQWNADASVTRVIIGMLEDIRDDQIKQRRRASEGSMSR